MDDHPKQSPAAPPRVLRRTGRSTLKAATLLSAAFALAFGSLWIRSHFTADEFSLEGARRYAVRTLPGLLVYERERAFAGRLVERSPPPVGPLVQVPDPSGLAGTVIAPALKTSKLGPAAAAAVLSNTVVEGSIRPTWQWSHTPRGTVGWPLLPGRRWIGCGWGTGRLWTVMTMHSRLKPDGTYYDIAGRPRPGGWLEYEYDLRGLAHDQAFAPLWLLTTIALILPIARCWVVVRQLRPKPGHCPRCGYDLRASPGRCPECGSLARG